MQVLTRTAILAVCLLGAFALPNLRPSNPNSDNVYQLLLAQEDSALINSRALSPGESSCAGYYKDQTQTINALLANQTNRCFESSHNTKINNNQNANQSVAQMRITMQYVEQQLHNCGAQTAFPAFLNCTTATYDSNLLMLDSLNTQAYQVHAEFAASLFQVEIVRQACIDSAIGSAKANLTIATNDYNACLQNIPNQRNYESMNLLN